MKDHVILIEIEGGVLSAVYTNYPDLAPTVRILDRDNEEAGDDFSEENALLESRGFTCIY